MNICKKIIMLAFAFLFCLTGTPCASEEERSDIDPNGTILVESCLNETRAKEIYLKELILAEDMIAEQLFVEKNIQEVTLCRTFLFLRIIWKNLQNIAKYPNFLTLILI